MPENKLQAIHKLNPIAKKNTFLKTDISINNPGSNRNESPSRKSGGKKSSGMIRKWQRKSKSNRVSLLRVTKPKRSQATSSKKIIFALLHQFALLCTLKVQTGCKQVQSCKQNSQKIRIVQDHHNFLSLPPPKEIYGRPHACLLRDPSRREPGHFSGVLRRCWDSPPRHGYPHAPLLRREPPSVYLLPRRDHTQHRRSNPYCDRRFFDDLPPAALRDSAASGRTDIPDLRTRDDRRRSTPAHNPRLPCLSRNTVVLPALGQEIFARNIPRPEPLSYDYKRRISHTAHFGICRSGGHIPLGDRLLRNHNFFISSRRKVQGKETIPTFSPPDNRIRDDHECTVSRLVTGGVLGIEIQKTRRCRGIADDPEMSTFVFVFERKGKIGHDPLRISAPVEESRTSVILEIRCISVSLFFFLDDIVPNETCDVPSLSKVRRYVSFR